MNDTNDAAETDILLEARDIGWVRERKAILSSIDFGLRRGECVGVIGPNGSGKSSLLKILAFLEAPTSGTLYWLRQRLPHRVPLSLRRQITMVFQEPLLLNTSVFDNIAVGLRIRGVSARVIREKADYWMAQFGIAHLRRQTARSLSGGEAQRVSLARAFILDPALLFLDEPFSALDAPTRKEIRADLRKVFHNTRSATVIVSHDFTDIRELTDRALLLLEGRIAAAGSPREILDHLPAAFAMDGPVGCAS